SNCACYPIKIIGTEEGPVVASILEKCLVPGSSLTILGRNFGTVSGTITAVSTSGMSINLSVSSWNDSTVVVRIPNDSRMQEGQQYTINIMKNGEIESIPTGRQNIGICPTQKKTIIPGTTQPTPPFFFEQQP
ncbi:MAG: IPT/TIG domain-containing protein, partial [Geobacteraceae bacterium]|nr:IPT/TIG domain-containing protein [Geobacteraceae bacterium]